MNEEEKKAIERLEEQLNFWKKQNIKNSDCEIILNLITKLQKENEEKDKQIDLMAFNLADYVMYYEYDKCRNPEMIKNKAEEIKQYFENKVNSSEQN